MKKTCLNCEHFHGCLAEESSGYHIHDYCDALDRSFGCCNRSLVNEFLVEHTADSRYANVNGFIYDDFETGEAYCWMFRPSDNAAGQYDDAFFEDNRAHNLRMAIKTLEHMLSEKRICDEYSFDKYNPEYPEITDEELSEYAKLLGELKNRGME